MLPRPEKLFHYRDWRHVMVVGVSNAKGDFQLVSEIARWAWNETMQYLRSQWTIVLLK